MGEANSPQPLTIHHNSVVTFEGVCRSTVLRILVLKLPLVSCESLGWDVEDGGHGSAEMQMER